MKKITTSLLLACLMCLSATHARAELTQLNGVYQIGTAQDLADFAALVNAGTVNVNAELTADIPMEGQTWTGISGFTGTFDGDNHKISNLAGPLFAITGSGVKIQNLTLEGAFTTSTNPSAAFISKHDGALINLINLVNKTAVTSTTDNVGAFIGVTNNLGSNPVSLIKDCINEANIIGVNNVGAIIGNQRFEADDVCLTIVDCGNKGDISGVSCVGGLVGFNRVGVNYTSSWNEGDITGTSEATGGLLGRSRSGKQNFHFCHNTGNVTGVKYVGGLFGDYNRVNTTYTYYTTFEDSYNKGTVYGTGDNIGGLLGRAEVTTTSPFVFTRCYNTGDIYGPKAYRPRALHHWTNATVTITDCWNIGEVKSIDNDFGASDVYTMTNLASYSRLTLTNSYDLANVAMAPKYGRPEGYEDAWLTNGHFCYFMNGDQSSIVWKQTLGTDANPVLDSSHGTVHKATSATTNYYYNDAVASMTLTDAEDYSADADFTATSLTYNRTLAAGGYHSLCLPFGVTTTMLGEGSKLFTVKTLGTDAITLEEKSSVEAGVPCFASVTSDFTFPVMSNVVMKKSVTDAGVLKGTYTNQTINAGFYKLNSTGEYFGLTTDGATATAFRSYIAAPAGVKTLRILLNDGTSITPAFSEEREPAVVYDLSGRRVEKAAKGIYIVNGKKVLK